MVKMAHLNKIYGQVLESSPSVVRSPQSLPERPVQRGFPRSRHRLLDVGEEASLGFVLHRRRLRQLGQLRLQRGNLPVLCNVLLYDVFHRFGLDGN